MKSNFELLHLNHIICLHLIWQFPVVGFLIVHAQVVSCKYEDFAPILDLLFYRKI